MVRVRLQHIFRRLLIASFLLSATVCLLGAEPADKLIQWHHTDNFFTYAQAPTPAAAAQLAERCGEFAEDYRRILALHWLGEELPKWHTPCVLRVSMGINEKRRGKLSVIEGDFRGNFTQGGDLSSEWIQGRWQQRVQPARVFGFNINVQPQNPDDALLSILPHEVLHAIFYTHFRPKHSDYDSSLPVWAAEGASTYVEHESSRYDRVRDIRQYLGYSRPSKGIPLDQLFAITKYPKEEDQKMIVYAQGYSLTEFLINRQGGGAEGAQAFVRFLEQGLASDDWETALYNQYGYTGRAALQEDWMNRWARPQNKEMPKERPPRPEIPASAEEAFELWKAGLSRGPFEAYPAR